MRRLRGRQPVAALAPLRSAHNAFAGEFAGAVARLGYSVRHLAWQEVGRLPLDLIILHWPDDFLRDGPFGAIGKRLLRLYAARLRGTKILWVAHNVRPHEGDRSRWPIIDRLFLNALHGIIYLSRVSVGIVEAELSPPARLRRIVTVHGAYGDVGATLPRSAPSTQQLLFFGKIRPYKNLEVLLDVFRRGETAARLRIVGHCTDVSYGEALAKRAASIPRVALDLRPKPLSDDEISAEIDRADGIVLPYKRILNSGAAIHALSRYRPVLAPRLGSMAEVQEEVGGEWLHLYDGRLTAETLDAFLGDIRTPPARQPGMAAYSWHRVAADLRRALDGGGDVARASDEVGARSISDARS